jgi:hypothetical protein
MAFAIGVLFARFGLSVAAGKQNRRECIPCGEPE